jgi:hypothetical protein
MGEKLFTADEAWNGGFYELALEVGARSDDRLRAALKALWSHPDLDGCYLDRGREPSDQPREQPDCLGERVAPARCRPTPKRFRRLTATGAGESWCGMAIVGFARASRFATSF